MRERCDSPVRRLWFPNLEDNFLTTDTDYETIARGKVQNLAHRFISCLVPGDALVTSCRLDMDFCNYNARVLGLEDASQWIVEVAQSAQPYSLGQSVLHDPEGLRRIEALVGEGSWIIEPYVQSNNYLDISHALGLPVNYTPRELIRRGLVNQFNDKAWFKDHAEELGIRTVPGLVADSAHALGWAIDEAAAQFGNRIMLRKTLHAGGHGNLAGSPEQLLQRLPHWYADGRVLVEPFLDIVSTSGSLAYLDETGPTFMGLDVQVFADGKWGGFDYPYPEGPAAAAMRAQTLVVARSAHEQGARGYLNLDWAITAEDPAEPVLLECNFRHNGFSFLLDFVRRYFKADPGDYLIRYREGIRCEAETLDQLIQGFSGLSVDGEPVLITEPGAGEGLLIVMPPVDHHCSIAVFSPRAAYIEHVMAQLAAMKPVQPRERRQGRGRKESA